MRWPTSAPANLAGLAAYPMYAEADHVLWGTDSIWCGTPQWQINARKTFKMPQRLMDEFGYPDITDEVKAQIFERNAARLHDIDIEAVRCTLPEDRLAMARAEYQTGAIPSLRTYGPKTRRDFLKMAFGRRQPGKPTEA